MELVKRIKDRSPEYDAQYFQLILDFTIEQGSSMGTSSEFDRWKQGKFFSTRYEIYIYAALLGLKKDYSIPIKYGTSKEKFLPISGWKPAEVVDFLILSLIGKTGISLNELEDLEEEAVEKYISDLRVKLEGYANGGFDIIRSERETDPSFFESDDCFLDLLDK